jgi:hypothetical protein
MHRVRRPSVGAVLGLLALIIAVAGNTDAFSAGRTVVIVHKGQIAEGAVTAKTLAPGAVRGRALAPGAVHARALAPGAVGPTAIALGAIGPSAVAPDAITSGAIAPGSVYGGSLGGVTIHSAPIADADTVAHNGEWTSSGTATATCDPGERVVSGGVVFTNPGDRQVAIIGSGPVATATAQGWVGQITSDSGGTATAEVQALCLR